MAIHFILLLIVLLINYFTYRKRARSSFVIAFTFIVLFIYLAIRYDYGTDYLNYYKLFNDQSLIEDSREILFWKIFYSFNSYEFFIFCHTAVFLITLYVFLRKNISPQYYVLFLLSFMLHPGMIYCYITAMRSALAASTFIIIAQYFYIKKKNIVIYLIGIIIASLFHTSAIVLILLPLFEFIISKLSVKIVLVCYCLLFIISAFFLQDIIQGILSGFDVFNRYSYYVEEDYIDSTSSSIIILRSLYLFPLYYMLRLYYSHKLSDEFNRIMVIAFLYFVILFVGLDFQNRYAIILFPYVIASVCLTLANTSNMLNKSIIIIPYLVVLFYLNYVMYKIYMENPFIQGNFIYYHTIFSIQ